MISITGCKVEHKHNTTSTTTLLALVIRCLDFYVLKLRVLKLVNMSAIQFIFTLS